VKQRRSGSFVVLLAVIFLGGLAVWHWKSGRSDDSTEKRAELISSSADQELQKFSLAGFDEKGKKFWNLEGDAAKIDPTQTVYLEENVTLKLKDDTIIHTDKVQWSQDRGYLRTDSPVEVERPNTHITGTGAIGRPNDGFVQLNRKITMKVQNGATTITCDGPMKIFYNENKLIFYRNVRVTDARGVLKSKRMDVFFDNDKKEVDRIIAVGDVVIERGTDTTHSKRAIYSTATGSLRLEGNPEIELHKAAKGLIGAAGN
jgi:lipopolysaccharide export system protein LptA